MTDFGKRLADLKMNSDDLSTNECDWLISELEERDAKLKDAVETLKKYKGKRCIEYMNDPATQEIKTSLSYLGADECLKRIEGKEPTSNPPEDQL